MSDARAATKPHLALKSQLYRASKGALAPAVISGSEGGGANGAAW